MRLRMTTTLLRISTRAMITSLRRTTRSCNGSTRTFAGLAWVDAYAADRILFGSDVASACVSCSIGGNSVKFFANVLGDSVSWASAWPGVNEWVHWALVFNEAGNTAELFINGVSKVSEVVCVGLRRFSRQSQARRAEDNTAIRLMARWMSSRSGIVP